MNHGVGIEGSDVPVTHGPFQRVLDLVNGLALRLSMIAMVFTAVILTYSVVTRYFLGAPTDWQDEISVFLLVGVTFSCTAWVQASRGHIGIEALATVLPPGVNRVRAFIVDVLSFLFCGFFAWKSWTLLHEAWVDKQTTSSTFAGPLWVPYSLMAVGMSLLTVQLLVQVLSHAARRSSRKP